MRWEVVHKSRNVRFAVTAYAGGEGRDQTAQPVDLSWIHLRLAPAACAQNTTRTNDTGAACGNAVKAITSKRWLPDSRLYIELLLPPTNAVAWPKPLQRCAPPARTTAARASSIFKCEKHCEVQHSANQLKFVCMPRFRASLKAMPASMSAPPCGCFLCAGSLRAVRGPSVDRPVRAHLSHDGHVGPLSVSSPPADPPPPRGCDAPLGGVAPPTHCRRRQAIEGRRGDRSPRATTATSGAAGGFRRSTDAETVAGPNFWPGRRRSRLGLALARDAVSGASGRSLLFDQHMWLHRCRDVRGTSIRAAHAARRTNLAASFPATFRAPVAPSLVRTRAPALISKPKSTFSFS